MSPPASLVALGKVLPLPGTEEPLLCAVEGIGCYLNPQFLDFFLETGAGFNWISNPASHSTQHTCFPAVSPRNGAAGRLGCLGTDCAILGTTFMPMPGIGGDDPVPWSLWAEVSPYD